MYECFYYNACIFYRAIHCHAKRVARGNGGADALVVVVVNTRSSNEEPCTIETKKDEIFSGSMVIFPSARRFLEIKKRKHVRE